MSRTATATLQTPWDCKWSRFGRMHASALAHAEGLWVCIYPGGTRRPIDVAECETCPHWEYEPPAVVNAARPAAPTTTHDRAATVVAACRHCSRTEQRLEAGVRVAALMLATVFAATGFVVLTRPLAIPLTISLWLGALTCFLLGIWGNFNRSSLPARSW
jgi:hypothetical protein